MHPSGVCGAVVPLYVAVPHFKKTCGCGILVRAPCKVYWKCMLNFLTKNKIVELELDLVNGVKRA